MTHNQISVKCPEKWELASASAKVQRSRICSRSAAIYACSLALLQLVGNVTLSDDFQFDQLKLLSKAATTSKGANNGQKIGCCWLGGNVRNMYLHFQLKNAPSLLYICESKICLKFSVFMRRNEELTPIPMLLSYTFQSHQKLCEQECLLE